MVAAVAFDDEPGPLHEAESALVAAARSEGRRLELRAGRAAASRAFEAAGLTPAPAVLSEASGRPVVDTPGWHVSIAHDARIALAAVARRPVGVDVLDLSRGDDVARVVGARIASGRARPLLGAGVPAVPSHLLLWSAWEALGKRTGGGILSGPMMLDIEARPVDEGAVARVAGEHVWWFIDGGLLVCIATTPESP